MKVEDLKIVYCKNCRYFKEHKVRNGVILECARNNYLNNNPELFVNKKCFKSKEIK